MAHEALRGFLQIGILIGGCGFVLIFMQPPNSPGWVLSICSAIIGGVLVLAALLLARFLCDK
jgi:hypothetical protein